MGFVLIVMIAASLNAGAMPGSPSPQPLAARHFADESSCEQAASASNPAPGTRLVCVAAGTDTALHFAH